LVDRFTVWRYGATAVWLNGNHATLLTDRTWRGTRPWVPPPPTPHAHVAPTLPPAPTDTEALTE
jgi:competence protein ComEC